jgi:lipopolysaccharide heptosyltransferase II
LGYAVSSLATSLHAPRWKPGALHRILVVKTDHLGDFLLCLPAVRDFRESEEGAVIEFVVGSPTLPLAARVPWISDVHVWDSPRYVRHGNPSPDSALKAILAKDYDLILDLTNDRAVALAALRRPSPHRRDVGSYRLREKAKALVGRGRGLRETHAARVFYRALALPVPDPIVPQPLALREDDRTRATELLARGWPGDRPIAAIHAGASWEFRQWPKSRFQQLARDLEERGFSVCFLGGPGDRGISEALCAGAELRRERNLAGECDLPATAAVLERASVLVANDGGLVHLAAAQGTPVVGIFGPQDPDLFGPLGDRSRVLYRKRDCSPCSQRHCVWGRSRCLEPIETSDVLEKALEVAR